ncbi:mCG140772 [Mus musculus]|nr:mCG140772 [Mus musculus]
MPQVTVPGSRPAPGCQADGILTSLTSPNNFWEMAQTHALGLHEASFAGRVWGQNSLAPPKAQAFSQARPRANNSTECSTADRPSKKGLSESRLLHKPRIWARGDSFGETCQNRQLSQAG